MWLSGCLSLHLQVLMPPYICHMCKQDSDALRLVMSCELWSCSVELKNCTLMENVLFFTVTSITISSNFFFFLIYKKGGTKASRTSAMISFVTFDIWCLYHLWHLMSMVSLTSGVYITCDIWCLISLVTFDVCITCDIWCVSRVTSNVIYHLWHLMSYITCDI